MTSIIPDLERLHERLDQLERQNRRWKLAATLMLVLGGAGILMAAQAKDKNEKISEMEKFVLRDPAGKQRAWFGVGKDGPALNFLNDDGNTGSSISMTNNGLVLRLNNNMGKFQAGINLNKSGIFLASYGTGNRIESGPNAINETAGPFTP